VALWLESHGNIQARCPLLQKPRIAVHHGIRREVSTAISRYSKNHHTSRALFWYRIFRRGDCHIPCLVEHLLDEGGDHNLLVAFDAKGKQCVFLEFALSNKLGVVFK